MIVLIFFLISLFRSSSSSCFSLFTLYVSKYLFISSRLLHLVAYSFSQYSYIICISVASIVVFLLSL